MAASPGPPGISLPQKLSLALLEFRVCDDTPVSQIGQLGQFISAVLALRLEPLIPAEPLILRGVSCRDLLSGQVRTAHDQIGKYADKRQHNHQDKPAHLGPGAEVMAPEDAEHDPDD